MVFRRAESCEHRTWASCARRVGCAKGDVREEGSPRQRGTRFPSAAEGDPHFTENPVLPQARNAVDAATPPGVHPGSKEGSPAQPASVDPNKAVGLSPSSTPPAAIGLPKPLTPRPASTATAAAAAVAAASMPWEEDSPFATL